MIKAISRRRMGAIIQPLTFRHRRLASKDAITAPLPRGERERATLQSVRHALFWLPLTLCLIGLVFQTSVQIGDILKASAASPMEPFRPVILQACWVLLSAGMMLILAHIPSRFYQASAWFWLVLSALVLIALWRIPGLGVERNGAVRWFEFTLPALGRISVQPSEMFKLTTLLYFAALYSRRRAWSKAAYGLIALWLIALIAIERQPDFGTMALIFALGVGVAFHGGASLTRIALLGLASLMAFALLICLPAIKAAFTDKPHAIDETGYRLKRILVMLNPWEYEHDIGYQMVWSQIAVGSGGIGRLAIGEGRGKRYLPAAENDYIFATIAEETGFAGSVLCIGLFAWLVGACLKLAARAPTRFGRLFAGGLALWIGLQALINIGMAIGLLPTVGLPLPFVSAGGSALVSLMAALGIAQAIARETR